MTLIKCPECAREISDKCDKCIHCGYPIRNTPYIHEFINGVDYDLSFLFDKPRTKIQQIKEIHDLTNCGLTIAKNIVEKYNFPKIQENDETNNKLKCPKCKSTSIATSARGINWTWGLIGASKTVNRCANCGHTWKPI